MAGKLAQVSSNTVTSQVASVVLTGIDDDSVYLCTMNNVVNAGDGRQLTFRATVSGTGQSASSYVQGFRTLATVGGGNQGNHNISAWLDSEYSSGNGTGEGDNGMFYLYNFNSSSQYSYTSLEVVKFQLTPYLAGLNGTGAYQVAESHDGVEFRWSDGSDFAKGTFCLFKVVSE